MADEYIKREAALEAIRNLYPGIPFTKRLMQKWHEENRNFMQCENAIEKLPAADVVPVRHGRWTKKHDDVCYWHECSECGERLPLNQWRQPWQSSYCPNCGAKMGGEA